jgi:DNA mismatch repair protein MutS
MTRSPDPGLPPTPMMQQYLSVKEKYAEEILFFRMGDFYEMFFDDAIVASEILGIALTSRSREKDGAIPMAGVPVRAVDSYLPKLLRAGKRVAICEQVEDPKTAKGLVDREVIRVITPGTVTDERVIGEKSHNYLASLCPHLGDRSGGWGLAWLDVTTGQFLVWETELFDAAAAQLSHVSPAECLLPESFAFDLDKHPPIQALVRDLFVTPYPDPLFERATAYRTLVEHFRTQSLEGFGCEHLVLGVRAGGGLLRYVQETQKASLAHLTHVKPFHEHRVVPIDRATRRALEITATQREGERKGTLLSAFDRTATAPGGRKLREWLLEPLTEVPAIVRRQEAVAELVDDSRLREEVTRTLREVHDLERIATRISYGTANARDLVALERTLAAVPQMRALLACARSAMLRESSARLCDLEELRAEIARTLVDEPPLALKEGGLVREACSAELDELRWIAKEGKQWFARYQQRESERTGIPSLKVGYNKVFGYYIEVTNPHKDKIPADYLRKQTLKNCERYITPDLKEYENKVLHARERAVELEYEIFAKLRDRAAGYIAPLQETADALAELDVVATFATLAVERGYTRPEVTNGTRLFIADGRHPVVEQVASTEPFIPNSVDLDSDRHIMIITGPNMAGKSTYIRQVALLVLLAQTGSFIPARSAEIGVIDRLFTRVGASDDLTRGQSTFMVEMSETANILHNATARSLIVLDEVGRGTSTFDGLSLAWAITEFIAEHVRARTLFATHYHELTSITLNYPTARNYNFAVKEWNDQIIFLRKVVAGGADRSYGIQVARLAGIPDQVIERAREILGNLESQSLDLDDRPALARARRSASIAAVTADGAAVQLGFFHGVREEVLKELKGLDTDSMTPLEALQYLAEVRKRIV